MATVVRVRCCPDLIDSGEQSGSSTSRHHPLHPLGKAPTAEVAALPGISYHALARLAGGDTGELALEDGSSGPPFSRFISAEAVTRVVAKSRNRRDTLLAPATGQPHPSVSDPRLTRVTLFSISTSVRELLALNQRAVPQMYRAWCLLVGNVSSLVILRSARVRNALQNGFQLHAKGSANQEASPKSEYYTVQKIRSDLHLNGMGFTFF